MYSIAVKGGTLSGNYSRHQTDVSTTSCIMQMISTQRKPFLSAAKLFNLNLTVQL